MVTDLLRAGLTALGTKGLSEMDIIIMVRMFTCGVHWITLRINLKLILMKDLYQSSISTIIILLLMFLIYCGCNIGYKPTCEDEAENLIKHISLITHPSIFHGVSISGTGKKSLFGERNLRIDFADGINKSFRLPSYSERKDTFHFSVSDSNSVRFSQHFNQNSVDPARFILDRSKEITIAFRRFGIYEISSSMLLGDFVMFRIHSDCTLYYLKPGGKVSDRGRKLYSVLREISPNWYIE
jgi:hypothetical protein